MWGGKGEIEKMDMARRERGSGEEEREGGKDR